MALLHVVIELATLAATTLAFPFYVLFLVILVKYRKSMHLQTPFYKLLLVLGVLDLAYVLHNVIFFRSQLWGVAIGWHKRGGVALLVYWHVAMFYIRDMQIFCTVNISLNRLTAVVWPLKHKKYWTQNRLLALLLVQAVASVFLVVHLGSEWCGLRLLSFRNGTALRPFWNPECFSRTFTLSSVIGLSSSALLIVCHALIFASMVKQNKVHDTNQNANEQRIQRRLAFAGALIGMMCVLSALYSYFKGQFPGLYARNRVLHLVLSNALGSVYCMINPFVVLFTSSVVRNHFLKLFGRATTQQQATGGRSKSRKQTSRRNN